MDMLACRCFLSNILPGHLDILTLAAALIGVTSLIFAAKGNVWAQILMIVFSILYGIISYRFRYWGEMVTYLGMTLPMAVWSMITWIRNPSAEKRLGGRDTAAEPKAYRGTCDIHRGGNCGILLYLKSARYTKYGIQHYFSNHKLSRCIAYDASLIVLRAGICRK